MFCQKRKEVRAVGVERKVAVSVVAPWQVRVLVGCLTETEINVCTRCQSAAGLRSVSSGWLRCCYVVTDLNPL